MTASPTSLAASPPLDDDAVLAGALRHLEHLSDERGLYEHAEHDDLRPEHGYCTDDNARLLVVAARETLVDGAVSQRLGTSALAFVLGALDDEGRVRNRMDADGRWTDTGSTDDCWGRALWGLGSAAAHHGDPAVRRAARLGFDLGVRQRSRWPHAMAFAALGAADLLLVDRNHEGARSLVAAAVRRILHEPTAVGWVWPEARLTYANAALAEAILAGGAALDRPALVDRGLEMLRWLVDLQSTAGHLSVTGHRGRGPGETGPDFDQQPIEVAALADACWRAYTLTGSAEWSDAVGMAANWFAASNDLGLVMYDAVSGGGYDGLQYDSVNLNQGAESTLALASTMQRARSLASS